MGALEKSFADAQEQQSHRFTSEIGLVLSQMEMSVSGLDKAASDVNQVLLNKADKQDLLDLRGEVEQMLGGDGGRNQKDVSGALAVQRRLSGNQSLQKPSTLDENLIFHNKFPAAPPPAILPPRSRPQSAMANGLVPQPVYNMAAHKGWNENAPVRLEGDSYASPGEPAMKGEHREQRQVHNHPAVRERAALRPSSSLQHRSRGLQHGNSRADRPLTALDHRQPQHSRGLNPNGVNARSVSATRTASPQAENLLAPEGVVSTTMQFTKRPDSVGPLRGRPLSALPPRVSPATNVVLA